jgi:aquaporin Z
MIFDIYLKFTFYSLTMKLTYRLFAEFIGTLALVLIGCGSAVIAGKEVGYLGISFAFGLTVTCLAYAVGGISGGHFNPAVTLSQVLLKKNTLLEGVYYVVAQILGALSGSAILMAIKNSNITLGENLVNTKNGYNSTQAFIAELIFTFLFVYVIIGVTSSYSHNKFAPLAIGFMLVLCHIVLIPVTGTSVNPARSLAPALFVGGTALTDLWIFILAPLLGSALAVLASLVFTPNGDVE